MIFFVGFFKYVVTPLILQWHIFLQNDLSAQMLEYLTNNQAKWAALVAEDIAAKKRAQNSAADRVDDDVQSCASTSTSDSSELLLPGRRASLSPSKPIDFKEQLRRFSVPLNVFQDSRLQKGETESRADSHSQGQACDDLYGMCHLFYFLIIFNICYH